MSQRIVILSVIAFAFLGCSSNGSSTADLSAPSVSLRADVMPVLTAHCASCHADPNSAPMGIVLGEDASLARTSLLEPTANIPSNRSYALPYIAPGNPEGSMLVHMLDWDMSAVDCQWPKICGTAMPLDEGRLCDDDRLVVRRWIAQGALDN